MLILAGLASVKHAGAFKLAATCFGTDKQLNETVAVTLAQLVGTLPGRADHETTAVLKQALPLLRDRKLKAAVQKTLSAGASKAAQAQ